MIKIKPNLEVEKEKKKRKIFLLREAAKKIVDDLRNQSPFFSKALDAKVFITKKYLQHILYVKKRNNEETEERLIISAFLDMSITEGFMFSTRKVDDNIFYELHYKIKTETIVVIILKIKNKYILLSSFVKYKKKHFV